MKKLCVTLLLGMLLSCQFSWGEQIAYPLTSIARLVGNDHAHRDEILRAHTKVGDPLRVDCLFILGVFAHEAGHYDEARKNIQEAFDHYRESSSPEFVYIVGLASLGLMDIEVDSNYTLGIEKLEQSTSMIDSVQPGLKPAIAELYAEYSDNLYVAGNLKEANRMLKKAFALDPKCEGCRDTLKDLQNADTSPDYFNQQYKNLTRWNDETHLITVYLSTGEGLKDWKANNLELAKRALEQWSKASNQRFEFQIVNDPSLADVRFLWYEAYLKSADGVAIGMSIPNYSGTTLDKNDVVICLHDDHGRRLSTDEISTTILHELGHMLGIQGHSPNWGDVMASESVTSVISDRDIATLNRIYASTPTYTNPKGISLANYREQNLSAQEVGIIIPKVK